MWYISVIHLYDNFFYGVFIDYLYVAETIFLIYNYALVGVGSESSTLALSSISDWLLLD